MTNPAANYENALNGADGIYQEGFWSVVAQADESELAEWAEAFRAVGLNRQASLLSTYLETDAKALNAWKSAPSDNSQFEPSRDWDEEFAAALGQGGYEKVEQTVEQFRLRHGLDEL